MEMTGDWRELSGNVSHAVAKVSTQGGTGKGKGEENFPEVLKAEKSKRSWENLLKIRWNEQQVQNNGGTDTRTLLAQGSGEHTVECKRKGRAMSRRHPYSRPRVAKLQSVDLDSALQGSLWKLCGHGAGKVSLEGGTCNTVIALSMWSGKMQSPRLLQ